MKLFAWCDKDQLSELAAAWPIWSAIATALIVGTGVGFVVGWSVYT